MVSILTEVLESSQWSNMDLGLSLVAELDQCLPVTGWFEFDIPNGKVTHAQTDLHTVYCRFPWEYTPSITAQPTSALYSWRCSIETMYLILCLRLLIFIGLMNFGFAPFITKKKR